MKKMKAVICTKYGEPELLKIMEVEKPRPKDNELLIKIMTSAVNYGDTRVRRLEEKEPLRFIMRFVLGFSTSIIFNTSGAPYLVQITAFILSSLLSAAGADHTYFLPWIRFHFAGLEADSLQTLTQYREHRTICL